MFSQLRGDPSSPLNISQTAGQSSNTTVRVGEMFFLYATPHREVVADVVGETKRRVLDAIGCTLAGFPSEPGAIMRGVAQDLGGGSGRAVPGGGERLGSGVQEAESREVRRPGGAVRAGGEIAPVDRDPHPVGAEAAQRPQRGGGARRRVEDQQVVVLDRQLLTVRSGCRARPPEQ
ncbi:hypothetical protein B4Q13_21870, partial [Lacticaseibacillus rhamnosus]